jgi:hypothetical protein
MGVVLRTTPISLHPRQDSNLRTRLRRPMLYPLSYEGLGSGMVAAAQPSAQSDRPGGSSATTGARMIRTCTDSPRTSIAGAAIVSQPSPSYIATAAP